MTTLRRVGEMILIPGTPAVPAVPGYSKFVELPDPPSQTELSFGGAGVQTQTLFGAGSKVVISSDASKSTSGNGYPQIPSITTTDGYNGGAGKTVTVVSPDGSIKVVRV